MNTYDNFKNNILNNIPEIPNIITEEWLKESLKNNLFNIWGFSFSDLSNKKFDKNINEELLNKVSFSTKTILNDESPIRIKDDMFEIDDLFVKLHNNCINGEEINVAVLDYGFNTINDEIKDNLIKYNKVSERYHFHGSVVSSILVGKKIGVCPKAKLHFYDISYSNQVLDVINALKDIYKLNQEGANIRVVNISASLHRENKEFLIICDKLKDQGCYVIDSINFGEHFTCINKSYKTKKYYYNDWQPERHRKLMGVYTPTFVIPLVETENDYIFQERVSYSWTIPVISGVFTLALQVNKNLTFDEFVQIAEETKITNEDGIILLNPTGIIQSIQKDIEDEEFRR